MAENPRISRAQLAANDIEALLLDQKFLRFLSTIRLTAGIETTAYGPADRHLYFAEGRRSLWCDILRTAEKAQPDTLLAILTAESNASKETSNGRRKYNRLDTDDDRPSSGAGLVDFIDYGTTGNGTDAG